MLLQKCLVVGSHGHSTVFGLYIYWSNFHLYTISHKLSGTQLQWSGLFELWTWDRRASPPEFRKENIALNHYDHYCCSKDSSTNTTHRHHGWCAGAHCCVVVSWHRLERLRGDRNGYQTHLSFHRELRSELIIVLIIIDLYQYQYQVSLSDLSPRMTIQADQCHLVAASCPSVPPATTCQDVMNNNNNNS